MRLLRIALEAHAETEAKKVFSEPTQGLWFRHESPHKLSLLRPLKYHELKKAREGYDVKTRQEFEDTYRKLTHTHHDVSFLYATVVGYNKMEAPESYPGFTYFFQLDASQLAKCLFTIVDKKEWMEPTLGEDGLHKAQSLWKQHQSSMSAFKEEGFGMVDPRIEVVIPFSVKPKQYYPQEEDR
jgi:hypothetical protein